MLNRVRTTIVIASKLIRSPILLGVLLGILAFSISLTGITPVNAAMFNPKEYSLTAPTSGSGSAGTGSVAVAAFFSGSTSKGLGAFSGSLMPLGIGGTNFDVSGIFSLTDPNPSILPVLPCKPVSEIGASGRVVSGSFLGQQVVIAGCADKSNFTVVLLSDGAPNCIGSLSHTGCTYSGEGTGNVAVIKSSILAGTVIAANTVGGGSAGGVGVDAAQVLVVASDGSVLAGGAFVGKTSDIVKNNNNWMTNRASIQPGCTLTTQGVTSPFGSFPNQPVTTSATPTSCPQASLGPQPVTVTLVIGSAINPIYAGHGSGTAMAAIQNTR